MKLAVSLLTLAVSWTFVASGNVKTTSGETSEELLKRAASQLERLSAFRHTREPLHTTTEIPPDENELSRNAPEVETESEILEARKRIDELRASASEVLRDPRYAAIMQDRIKRSFISGIANRLIGGAVGAVSGLSRGVSGLSSSNTPSEYGAYGHSYEREFSIWDFKKAIINTLIQAIKAIGGGAIAGGGALVKGGGLLVSAKGRFISSAGDAITSLGKSLASSAIIASAKPVYGPPGYSYGAPPVPAVDHIYDGPPPSADAYAGPVDAYNADHSSYAAPSNDDGVDNDVSIAKDSKPEVNSEDHAPSLNGPDSNTNLAALEDSFGGPPKGTTTITKIIGVLNSGQPTIEEHNDNRQEVADHHQEISGQAYHQENAGHQEFSSHQGFSEPGHQAGINSHQTSSKDPIYEIPFIALPLSNDQPGPNNPDHNRYPSSAQVYDSYGTRLENSPQLTQVHQPVQDSHQSLGHQIQNVLSPFPEVPKFEDPKIFSQPTSNFNYQYDAGLYQPQPFKALDNHLDHHTQTAANFYGLPSYGAQAHQLDISIGHQPSTVAMPILPQDYPINGPSGYGQPFNLAASGGPALLGVWRRTGRRTPARTLGKRMFEDKTPQFQRSVGYRLVNGRLTRT